jgi:protein arginine kinase
VVVSSRVRIARNLAYYPFLPRASAEDRAGLLDLLRSQVAALKGTGKLPYYDVHELNPVERQFLVERQLISRDFAAAEGPRAVFFDRHERVSFLINEEDHLRIHTTAAGFSLKPLLEKATEYERALDRELTFAYHPEYGYATPNLRNTGTGLRVSVMLHLPGMVLTKQIEKVFRALQKINLAVRGLYGEGSRASGDFYQIGSGIALGKSERTILMELEELIPHIVTYERQARQVLLRESRGALEDRISRARGTLSSATRITSEETMDLLSSVRLGVHLSFFKDLALPTIDKLFLHTQPAHLMMLHHADLDSDERNAARARYLKEQIASWPTWP